MLVQAEGSVASVDVRRVMRTFGPVVTQLVTRQPALLPRWDEPLRLPLAAENVDEAAQSIASTLEVLTVDVVLCVPKLGSQTIERGVQDLSEQFNIVVGQIDLHRGLLLGDLSLGVEAR